MAEIPVKPDGGGAAKAKTWIWWVIAALVVIVLFFIFSNRSSANELAMPGATLDHASTVAASSHNQPVNPTLLAR